MTFTTMSQTDRHTYKLLYDFVDFFFFCTGILSISTCIPNSERHHTDEMKEMG